MDHNEVVLRAMYAQPIMIREARHRFAVDCRHRIAFNVIHREFSIPGMPSCVSPKYSMCHFLHAHKKEIRDPRRRGPLATPLAAPVRVPFQQSLAELQPQQTLACGWSASAARDAATLPTHRAYTRCVPWACMPSTCRCRSRPGASRLSMRQHHDAFTGARR